MISIVVESTWKDGATKVGVTGDAPSRWNLSDVRKPSTSCGILATHAAEADPRCSEATESHDYVESPPKRKVHTYYGDTFPYGPIFACVHDPYKSPEDEERWMKRPPKSRLTISSMVGCRVFVVERGRWMNRFMGYRVVTLRARILVRFVVLMKFLGIGVVILNSRVIGRRPVHITETPGGN